MRWRLFSPRYAFVALCFALRAMAQTTSPPEDAPVVRRTTVSEFRITGNSLLPSAALEASLARFKGERSVDELKQAAFAIQEAYRKVGYGGVVAFVSPQGVSGGVVTITVLEGKLRKVMVNGNHQFSDANIRRSLPALAVGSTPRLDLADAQIQLANENPAKQVQVLLQPGQETGDVEAQLTVIEEPVQRWNVALDNRGT